MGAADKPTDAALLASIGLAMFGQEWPAPMARLLGLNVRTLQRLANAVREGRGYPLNPNVLKELALTLRERARAHLADAERLEIAAEAAERR